MHPDDIEPFTTVLKDGYAMADCVKDRMYVHGDKHGNGKFEYKMGDIANVSIVHYTEIVPKEDQEEMTHGVCFEFCRTVPDMGFFGINNGRDCYCAPYYDPIAGNSDECDATCPGDPTTMCGGKTKSNIFSMHMCASTEADLGTRSSTAGSLKASMDAKVSAAKGLSGDMQSMGAKLQKTFGAVGDSGASGLMQDAKVSAGTLVHKAEDAGAVADKLGALVTSANGIKGFTDPATVTKAERIMEDIDETVAQGEAVTDQQIGRASCRERV